jgi:hypothetical protein
MERQAWGAACAGAKTQCAARPRAQLAFQVELAADGHGVRYGACVWAVEPSVLTRAREKKNAKKKIAYGGQRRQNRILLRKKEKKIMPRPRAPALVVVCGPPGAGKTTAVAAIAAALAAAGAGRVDVVDGAAVRRPPALAHAGEWPLARRPTPPPVLPLPFHAPPPHAIQHLHAQIRRPTRSRAARTGRPWSAPWRRARRRP